MDIKKFSYNGHQFFIIRNEADLEITFCNYGASIFAIKYKDNYITYHPENDYVFLSSKKYYGKTLGRVCGRLKGASIQINGNDYKLEENEGNNTLHGGIENISFKNFEAVFNETDDLINVVFKYTSPALECGFPGEVRFIIIYALSKKVNKFSIHYHAIPKTTTPINMSTHIYWRLLGEDVLDHELFIDADERTVVDNELITTGKTKVDSIFDFRKTKKIGADIKALAEKDKAANGYDHGFVFNKGDGPKVILQANHIRLTVRTDNNMANIYTNCHTSGDKIRSYEKDVLYGGIAIEPQMYFTNYKDLLVDPEHPYDHFISFEIGDY